MNQINMSWVESLKARGFSGLSRFMAIVCLITALILIIVGASMGIGLAILAFQPSWAKEGIIGTLIHGPVHAESFATSDDLMIVLKKLMGVLAGFIPAGILAYGLLQARQCFLQLSCGHYFTLRTISTLRNFALAGLLYVVLLLGLPLLANILPSTLKGTFMIGNSTTCANLLTAIYAFTLAIIAALMTKASAIAEDNAQIT